jgi:hypothetical protein
MFNYTTTVAISLNIITIIINLSAVLVCLTIVSLIIYRFITKHMEKSERLSLYLTMNTLFALICTSVMLFIHVNMSTIDHDFDINSSSVWKTNSIECRLRGYTFFGFICATYWSFALQAFFRFARVVYPTRSWVDNINIYIFVFIPIQRVLAFAIVIPLLIGLNGIHLLLPYEIYCGVQFNKIASLVYASVAEV